MFNDFISIVRDKASRSGLLTQLEGRSDVRIAPTSFNEVFLSGLPRRYRDILTLLLVEDLIPEAMKPDFQLWKSHLVTQRKWSLDQRVLFRTFDAAREIEKFHPREVYGNLVPTALKLLGKLRYRKVTPKSVKYPQMKRGYTDQGSAAPYDKKARLEAVYSDYEEMNQNIVEDTDFLAEILGPAELQEIETHIGVRAARVVDNDGEIFSAGSMIPETRPEDESRESKEEHCVLEDTEFGSHNCDFCPPSIRKECNLY